MKVNLKSEESIVNNDTVTRISNQSESNYYIVVKSRLKVLEPGRSMGVATANVERITDKIDDIILYHSKILETFQNAQEDKEIIQTQNDSLDQ